MDLYQVSGREKRSTFVKVVIGCLIAFILAPPLAQAAVQAVRVKGAVNAKIKDSGGGRINSSSVAKMGVFQAEGSSGALDVRNFAGGGGFLGAANCTTADDAVGLTDTVEITDSIVTGIIITGTNATFTATAAALGSHQLPLLNFTVSNNDSTQFVGLGNGLTITTALRFRCTAGNDGNIVVIGQ